MRHATHLPSPSRWGSLPREVCRDGRRARLPAQFDAADTYDPDRYLAEPILASYLHGFGGGTHRCLGEHFAILLTHVVITRLFQRYELTLVDPDPVPVRTPAFKGPRSPCRIGYRPRQIGNHR